MNILVTAGNTLVPIDRVRGITNIFTGRTGATIALHSQARGHSVVLLTSHPELVPSVGAVREPAERWTVQPYRTFDELHTALAGRIERDHLDAVVHCAAVSDYRSAGIYAPAPGTHFDATSHCWTTTATTPQLLDRAAGKVKSDEPELWLRLVRTPKLVDRIRNDWGFRGILVKFKLEVGVSEPELLAIAERSRLQSAADLMVANTLEGAAAWAYLGPSAGAYQRIDRPELAGRLLEAVERLHKERTHG